MCSAIADALDVGTRPDWSADVKGSGRAMTTSYTTYRGRGFWANDTIIELWLHLLVHTLPADAEPAWTARAREDWAVQASVGFLGCVDVGLDRHLDGDSTRETEFLSLVTRFDDHLARLGPTIPAATATSYRIGGRTQFIADVKVEMLRQFSAELVELVTTRPTKPASEPS